MSTRKCICTTRRVLKDGTMKEYKAERTYTVTGWPQVPDDLKQKIIEQKKLGCTMKAIAINNNITEYCVRKVLKANQ